MRDGRMIHGSCLCGDIAYEAEGFGGPIVHCHCRTCQKAHSAAFATTGRVRREDFRWTRGEAGLRAFESTPGKLRRFCGRCGSQLISEWVDQPMVILRVATIEHGPTAEPAAHIWTSHQAPWDHGRDDLPRFAEGRPE